jgi:hypothetical protein
MSRQPCRPTGRRQRLGEPRSRDVVHRRLRLGADVGPGSPPPPVVARPPRPLAARPAPVRIPAVPRAATVSRPAHRAGHRRRGRGIALVLAVLATLVLVGLIGFGYAWARSHPAHRCPATCATSQHPAGA